MFKAVTFKDLACRTIPLETYIVKSSLLFKIVSEFKSRCIIAIMSELSREALEDVMYSIRHSLTVIASLLNHFNEGELMKVLNIFTTVLRYIKNSDAVVYNDDYLYTVRGLSAIKRYIKYTMITNDITSKLENLIDRFNNFVPGLEDCEPDSFVWLRFAEHSFSPMYDIALRILIEDIPYNERSTLRSSFMTLRSKLLKQRLSEASTLRAVMHLIIETIRTWFAKKAILDQVGWQIESFQNHAAVKVVIN